jgi:hypothetical protein
MLSYAEPCAACRQVTLLRLHQRERAPPRDALSAALLLARLLRACPAADTKEMAYLQAKLLADRSGG